MSAVQEVLDDSRLALCLIYGLTLWSFLPYLPNEFVFDDYGLVKENFNYDTITDLGWNLTAYRPVRYLTYMLDYQIFGEDPSGYRISNIIYHLGAITVLYFISYRYFLFCNCFIPIT